MRTLLLAALASAAFGQQIERPRMDLNSYAQMAALAALCATDYHSTQRALENVPSLREGNPAMACGRGLCTGRYAAISAAMGAGIYAANRYVAPKLTKRSRRILSATVWSMIGLRSYIVVRNYRIGGAR